MILSFLEKKPLLEDASSQWIFSAFSWALEQFDAELFYSDTILVLPSNEYFPGRADSMDGMAGLIFDQVKRYAGISHWPTQIADQNSCPLINTPKIQIQGALRGPDGIVQEQVSDEQRLLIPYNPQQLNNPEAMIASFAHIVAHYLGQMAKEPPPGGSEYWPHVTELLAIYIGFGLMFANSAFTFRGGCGSCYNPNANRDAYLSEIETTYALAIFAVLKEIPDSEVTRHLKKHLRGVYRRAAREIRAREDDVLLLRSAGRTAAVIEQ